MEYNKQPDPLSKPIKYLKNRISGATKKEAEIKAYGKYHKNPSQIEATKTYQAGLEAFLMSEEEAIKILNRNLRQEKDKGASNKAFELYARLKQLFPKEEGEFETGDLQITVKKK